MSFLKLVKPIQINELLSVPPHCMFCLDKNLVKHGKRKNKFGISLRYRCPKCSKTFSYNLGLGFRKVKHDPKYITQALQLYFTGVSFTDITRFFEMQEMSISPQAVYLWIKKYIKIIKAYVDGLVLQIGDTWRCDEIYLKIQGKQKYLFAMMDDESRFIITHYMGEKKHMRAATNLFLLAKNRAQKNPKTIITDGLHSYKVAYRKVFWTSRKPRVRHIYSTFEDNTKYLNNKMERWNGFFRHRQKTMKGIKKIDSVLIDGLIIYYNFIRVHSVLKKTPAECVGIHIQGKDRWLTLIQNATMENELWKR